MHTIIHGDCLEELKKLEDNSVDAVITDPPYGLSNTKPAQVADVLAAWVTGDTEKVPAKRGGFMGKDWDSFVPPPAVWAECMRVLKPGGHMAVFAGARTQDLMGLSIRLAGFEIRDTLGWVYGSGFPKSMDISKAIDKRRDEDLEPQARVAKWLVDRMAEKGMTRKNISDHFNAANVAQQWTTYWTDGAVKPRVPKWDQWQELKRLLEFSDEMDAEVWRLNGRKGTPGEAWEKREVTGVYEQPSAANEWAANYRGSKRAGAKERRDIPATSEAAKWDGWGTALKPAIEPIILARKPLDGTVANNVLAHGVGGLNIDACRVATGDTLSIGSGKPAFASDFSGSNPGTQNPAGRFPANVLLDEHAAKEMDEQSGWQKDGTAVRRNRKNSEANPNGIYSSHVREAEPDQTFGSGGGASRFFPVFKYQAKAPKKERPVIEREDGSKIQHPTVKPLALMEWLATLVTPEGGLVLDPFAGTGTTLQAATNKGFHPIGIEADADYIQLIHQRMEGGEQSTRNN